MAASPADAPPHVVEDCRGVLQVLSDGTIVRSPPPHPVDVPVDQSVEWKDLVYDAALGLGLRVYKPAPADGGGERRLPVVVAFHGGGFCINSYASPPFHAACTRLAAATGALVVSADYRLAPEHRLPAAIDDAATALLWLRDQSAGSGSGSGDPDPWISELADPARVLVTGESAGGLLAHHLSVRFSGAAADAALLHPLRLRGFVQLMPFFYGADPTPSELRRLPADAALTKELCDRYARLCLPAGATADHPFLNPFGPGAPALDAVAVAPTLVVAAGDDVLRDRDVEFARRVAGMGKPVELLEFPGQDHAFFSRVAWTPPVDELLREFKRFMDKACELN